MEGICRDQHRILRRDQPGSVRKRQYRPAHDGNHEFVLVFEPDTLAVHNLVAAVVDHWIAVGIETLRLHLHPVIAQLGRKNR